MIRLLVVEDSRTVQQALVAAFSADPEIRVVGTADNGQAAVDAARNLRPDIITMDINMPGMDGFEATRAIMSSHPVPIVIVTGKLDPRDSETLFRVMQAGALMVLPKPESPLSPGYAASVASLVQHIKLMSEIKVVRRTFARSEEKPAPSPALPAGRPEVEVVAIGASTGGPPLLQQILSGLSPAYGAAVLVVQHMAPGFSDSFAYWLNKNSALPVRVARDGMPILPGEVYLAPDGCHLEAGPAGKIALSGAPPDNGLRPSVTAMFRSVARHYGRNAAGVLLTGMGSDGAAGLKSLRESGGITIAQDRESSVVFGMPKEAIRLNAAQYILPPGEIIQLLKTLGKDRAEHPAAR